MYCTGTQTLCLSDVIGHPNHQLRQLTFDAFRNKFHPFFVIAQVEELHLLHLHTILVSQTLGVMSSEELQSSAAPVCRHDMAPYVAKVTLGAEGYEMQVYGLGCHPSKVSRNPF